ncbi:MAG: mechanosensitive ion channel protein MscS [Moraxellaceae bacterium]|jgi:MscS family membrane protein|nr:mechanosensitive ion channel protein MscS [Moraxellaceae bacterium]
MLESLQAYLSAAENLWMLRVFGVILATATLTLLARWLLARIGQRLARTQTLWDDAALTAAHKPLQALIWVLGLNLASNLIVAATDSEIFRHADRVRELLMIGILTWFLLRFASEAENALLSVPEGDGHIDATSTRAIAKLLRTAIIITAALMLLQKLGYSVSGVLAFGGIGGIAIGFAAKDLLANFFGGLMIYLDRPFSIGDSVRSPDRNIEGTVEYIGWRQTRIRTFDMRPLYVPNSTFASIAVENPSRMTHRRISQVLGVRYEDWQRLPALVDNIRAMLAQHDGIAQDQTMVVNFEKFSDSSLDILIYCFTKTSDFIEFHAVRQDIFFRILEIVDAEGAEIAFPTRTLHVASAPSGGLAP